jgi:hypothetical protein
MECKILSAHQRLEDVRLGAYDLLAAHTGYQHRQCLVPRPEKDKRAEQRHREKQ